MEPIAGKGLIGTGDMILVSDPNSNIGCDIKMPRRAGYSSFRTVYSEMLVQGYRPTDKRGGRTTFTKDDISIDLRGGYGQYEPLATITLRKKNP